MTTLIRNLALTGVAFYLLLAVLLSVVAMPGICAAAGAFDRAEISFDLPGLAGNPFDFTQNDVKLVIVCPDNRKLPLPAFFDGGQTWRVRMTPALAGKYVVRSVSLNGHNIQPQKLQPSEFEVSGAASPGFIRVAPDHHRFMTDDGSPYYPVGYNLGWHATGGSMPPITDSLGLMGGAGLNWTRIWMSYWDGKNLDWSVSPADQPAVGELSLKSARLWDQIVNAADANHVYFQMVLQHHGQYSTHANTNWAQHPWNKANGGWLDNPAQFFTDPKAIALTRSKYRYIIARWGYSPSIMAWELFNEVESTDGFKVDLESVARWHADMAAFFREQDPYHHLITTSSWTTEPKLWPAMDYYQAHVYPPDILSSLVNLDDQHLDRPYFYGEIGAIDGNLASPDETIHQLLWGSLMSRSSGAAEYWSWDIVEPKRLLSRFTAVQKFIAQSDLLGHPDMKPITVIPRTAEPGPLVFGPALGWAPSTGTQFKPRPDGIVEGIGNMPAFLQGNGKNQKMFPFAVFDVNYSTAGKFAVRIDQFTAKGARLVVTIDGQSAATFELAGEPAGLLAKPSLDATLEVPVSAGKHTIRLENTGEDWVRLRDFTLTPYAPQMGVFAKGDAESVVAWVFSRVPHEGSSITGDLQIPGLAAGKYHLTWWDTNEGKVMREELVLATDSQMLKVTTPPIARDLALWIRR